MKNNKIVNIILAVLIVATVAGVITAVIIGTSIRNNDDPAVTLPTVTDTPTGTTEPTDIDPVVPPVSTDKPEVTTEPDELPVWMDVENDPRPQVPSVVDSSNESGVKDE